MTYRTLKTFINKNTQPHNDKIFDLIPENIKSKIIFVIGNGSSNTAAYLSSIMSACEISHVHYLNDIGIEIYKKLLKNGAPFETDLLCKNAERIINNNKKALSNDDLFFALSLSLDECEYTLIEMSEEYYYFIKDKFSPHALILTSSNDLLECAPIDTQEIITLSKEENFDYISNQYNQNGARITFASPNKITLSSANLLGTCFYHYDYLYHISSIDLNNVAFAHLSIEAARIIFNAPRPYIYQGIETARLTCDLELYSLSPVIILREGKNDFKLHHALNFKVLTNDDKFEIPTDNTIFCGDKEYIQAIKDKLKKR